MLIEKKYLSVTLFTIIFVFFTLLVKNLQAAVFFHLLHGFEGGYKFTLINSSEMNNMIDKYNDHEMRENWNDSGYDYMEDYNFLNGFYVRYNLYKYLDKREERLSSYQFSAEFTRSYASSESFFDYQFETAYRNYEYTHSSLMIDFTYGYSFYKNLLTYVELGVGFDTFSIQSKLVTPENSVTSEVLAFENEQFTTDTDSTRMQNGVYSGNGYSIKIEIKNEYFVTNSFTVGLGLGLKYIDIGELWKEDNKNLYFRRSQEEQDEFLYSAFDISLKLGLGYYFILQ